MLFDDDEQLEVRHVVSLAHHDVSIYSGGDVTPEGELFIKRNAICLSRRTSAVDLAPDSQISKPFYLFSENCSAKEDFYFALLRNQEQAYATEARAPAPLTFDVKHIISLVQKLHSSEEHMQSRWLNAMIGRVFLGLYRTADVEALIREKLNKKISRVKRPAFLSDIEIRKIDTGESAPYFTNLRHKDLTVEGECSMEADVRYTGNFRIEVAAVARIDLGARLKAREVNLVLSLQVRKLEGHVLFKIKAPPSNRIWFSFSQMPKMEMTVEPIVSSRQITYTVILRQIEARIKEVIAETLVLPFWDDTPFFKTEHKKWRGGIFAGDDAVDASMHATTATATAEIGEVDDVDTVDAGSHPNTDMPPMEKSQSMPVIDPTASTGLFGLKLGGRNKALQTNPTSPTIIDSTALKEVASSTSIDIRKETPAKVRVERSSSFVSESTPIVGTETVNADVFKPSSPPGESAAVNAMAKLSGRTKSISASNSPIIPHMDSAISVQSALSRDPTDKEATNDVNLKSKLPRRSTASSMDNVTGEISTTKSSPTPSITGSTKSQGGSLARGLFSKREATTDTASITSTGNSSVDSPKRISLAAMSNAAGAAKRWGWNALHRAEAGKNGQGPDSEPEIDLTKPMGGGRPLPPPGIPLPMPEKKGKTAPAPAPRRKAVPPPNLADKSSPEMREEEGKRRPVPVPPLPKRRRQTEEDIHASQGDEVLVVAAPLAESEPTTPLPDDEGTYRRPFVQDAEDSSDEYEAGDSSGDASGEASGNDTNKGTPPALPPRNDRDYVDRSHGKNESAGEDDEYSAWMDNTGEDQPLPSHVTSEGLAH